MSEDVCSGQHTCERDDDGLFPSQTAREGSNNIRCRCLCLARARARKTRQQARRAFSRFQEKHRESTRWLLESIVF